MKCIASAVLLLAILGCDTRVSWPNEKFSATAWRQTQAAQRYRFVKDLLNSKTLIGQSRAGVVQLLGTPSSNAEPGNMAYVVKVGGTGFDQVFILDIRFTNGTVAEAFVRGD